jgi:LPXTG-motif cell wall-anchored protein
MSSNSKLAGLRTAAALSTAAAVAAFGIGTAPAALAGELPETVEESIGAVAPEPAAESGLEESALSKLPQSFLDGREAAVPGEEPAATESLDGIATEGSEEDPAPEAPASAPAPAAVEAPAPAAPREAPVAAGYEVSGSAWGDHFGDGDFDVEMGDYWAEGMEVELLDQDGSVLFTTVTDESGRYAFENIPAGTYRLRFLGGYPLGRGEGLDSDGSTPSFELKAEQPSMTFDVGFIVGEYWPSLLFAAYYDADRDGIFDDNEDGAPDFEMEILDEDGSVVASASTDEDGFSGGYLEAGRYRLRLVVPEGYAITGAEAAVLTDEEFASAQLAVDADGLTEAFEVNGEFSAFVTVGLAEIAAAAPAPAEREIEPAALQPEPVQEPATARSVPRLAETGSTAGTLAPLAGLALVAGVVLLRLARRKAA